MQKGYGASMGGLRLAGEILNNPENCLLQRVDRNILARTNAGQLAIKLAAARACRQ
jgi:hypothetical protein